jgi:hypothetical protein
MLCRFCEKDKTLIEAHIIARCLHEPLLDPSGPMMLISKDANNFPKRTHTGQYDKGILCADCDGKFSPWEQYTARLLVTPGASEKYKDVNPHEDFYTIDEFDYSSLKLCFLSILWRMSVSALPSFRNVRLGPFEAKVHQMLQDKNPGAVNEFPIVLVRLIDKLGSSIIPGTAGLKKYQERNIYQLGLPGYLGIVKVDKRATPSPLAQRVLAPGKPLIIGLANSNLSLSSIHRDFFDKSPRRE